MCGEHRTYLVLLMLRPGNFPSKIADAALYHGIYASGKRTWGGKVIKGGLIPPECPLTPFHQKISFLYLQLLYFFFRIL